MKYAIQQPNNVQLKSTDQITDFGEEQRSQVEHDEYFLYCNQVWNTYDLLGCCDRTPN